MISLQMPTFILFRRGQKVGDLIGANPQGLQVRVVFCFMLFALAILTRAIPGTSRQGRLILSSFAFVFPFSYLLSTR